MIRIKVIKRSDDFHASVEGDPGKWDCGSSSAEAIGALVLTHRGFFGVEIETPFKRYDGQPAKKGEE